MINYLVKMVIDIDISFNRILVGVINVF